MFFYCTGTYFFAHDSRGLYKVYNDTAIPVSLFNSLYRLSPYGWTVKYIYPPSKTTDLNKNLLPKIDTLTVSRDNPFPSHQHGKDKGNWYFGKKVELWILIQSGQVGIISPDPEMTH